MLNHIKSSNKEHLENHMCTAFKQHSVNNNSALVFYTYSVFIYLRTPILGVIVPENPILDNDLQTRFRDYQNHIQGRKLTSQRLIFLEHKNCNTILYAHTNPNDSNNRTYTIMTLPLASQVILDQVQGLT